MEINQQKYRKMKKIFNYIPFAALALSAVMSCTAEKYELQSASLMRSVEITMQDADRAKIYVDDEIAKSVTLPMIMGESIQLGVITNPQDLSELTFPSLVWTSSNEDVLTVDENGKMTAKAAGVSVVTVSPATINMIANASIKVTVFASVEKVTSISITDDSEHVSEFSPLPSCYIGETMTLTAKVTPEDATYKSVLWSSKDESIAVIDPVSGLVTGVSQGEVEMVATALDEGKVTASYKIYIDRVITPTGIKVVDAPESGEVFSLGDGSYQVKFETYPEVATKSLITWTSSNTDVARVDGKGKVTFLNYGEVDITATIPETEDVATGFGKTFTVKLNIPAGFYRDHFESEGNLPWIMATNGGTREWKSVEGGENYLWFTPNKANANTLRGDVKRSGTTYLSRNYPILCFRLDDVNDLEQKYARNITFDTSGQIDDGTKLSGGIGSNNNKWLKKYKCSDGSAILVYDLSKQGFGKSDGTNLLPEGQVGAFTTFQLKYADIRFPDKADYPSDPGVHYRMFWFHTFTSEEELSQYLNDWSAKTSITFN